MYLMFIAHYFDGGSWSDNNFKGIVRFDTNLNKWLSNASENGQPIDIENFKSVVFKYIESFKFNKVISEFMIFYNKNKHITIDIETKNKIKEIFKIINPSSL